MTRKASLQLRLNNLYRLAEHFDGTAAESVSTPNGGTRSITYTSLSQIEEMIEKLEAQLVRITDADNRPDGFGVAYPRYC